MPEEERLFGLSELRAAVAAGIVNETQAASLAALAQDRAGRRSALPAEDEPFEFFRGFAEILIAFGLLILLGGIALLLFAVGGVAVLIAIPAIMAAVSWWMARYFTIRRRMNLPSMVLVSAYSMGVYISALALLGQTGLSARVFALAAAALTVAATALWFRRFKLPFAMFVLGVFGFLAIYTLFAGLAPASGRVDSLDGLLNTIDPRFDPTLASLVFGVAAFAGAMWFDLRDRYRIGRYAATAFWLHLLAGAALVNAVVGNLYIGEGAASIGLTAVALLLFALVALVIDRRSLLTAGTAYIGAVIYWMVAGDGAASQREWALILIVLGLFFTLLGTWWVPLRGAILRALPDFPGKNRLPPYSETR